MLAKRRLLAITRLAGARGPPAGKTQGRLRDGLLRDDASQPARQTQIIRKPGLLLSRCIQNIGEIRSGESRPKF